MHAESTKAAAYHPDSHGVSNKWQPVRLILRPSLPQEMMLLLNIYLETLSDIAIDQRLSETLHEAFEDARLSEVRAEIGDVHPVYFSILEWVSAAVNKLTTTTFKAKPSCDIEDLGINNGHDVFTFAAT